MKRILVIGNIGSGKSVFSQKLGKKVKIPVIHLDKHFHRPNWTKPEPGEWDKIMHELVKDEKWIIDGTYKRTLPKRLKAADTVIFLDTPKWLSLYRTIKRRLMYRNRTRPDLPDFLKERLSFGLIKKLLTFPRVTIIKMVEGSGKELILLKNSKDIRTFINGLRLPLQGGDNS